MRGYHWAKNGVNQCSNYLGKDPKAYQEQCLSKKSERFLYLL